MPYNRVSKRPEGQPTRGKTASNRLRRVDNFILLYEPSLLTRTDWLPAPPLTSNNPNEKGGVAQALFVDLGYGFDARTTLESAARFRRVNPHLPILGVEIEKERVEAALPFADDKTFFRLGGFNLPLKEGEHVRLIRAFNVLRQYEEKDFASAYERLAQYVLPGGLMIEGTSTPYGQLWVANLARKTNPEHVILSEAKNLEHQSTETLRSLREKRYSLRVTSSWRLEALVFSTNFRMGFDITDFQAVLPKNLIHHVIPGEPIYDFFEAWRQSAAETAAMKVYGLRQWFIHSAESLAQKGYKINLQKKFLSRGWMIWEL